MLSDQDSVILIGIEGADGIEEVMMVAYTPFDGEYLMSVSIDDNHRHTAHVIWYAAQEPKARGVPWFNLGGGVQPGD